MSAQDITGGEQARRLMAVANTLDLPGRELLNAYLWISGQSDTRPAWVVERPPLRAVPDRGAS